MPFALTLLKNPTVIKWGIIIAVFVGLFTYGKVQYVRLEQAKADLVVAEQNIKTLESTIEAEKAKSEQRRLDAIAKQETINKLNTVHVELSADYAKVKDELEHLLVHVIPNVKTPEDVVEAKKVVQKALVNSYNCIEAATGGGAICEK